MAKRSSHIPTYVEVSENLGYIPEEGTDFRLGNYVIGIVSTKENAVETVTIKNSDEDYELKVVS